VSTNIKTLSTQAFNIGSKDVQRLSQSFVILSFKLLHIQARVLLCCSIKLPNFPHSEVIVSKAFVTSTAETFQASIIL
jgi:hypothetical protein